MAEKKENIIETKSDVKAETKSAKLCKAVALEPIRSSYGAFEKGASFEIPESVFENWIKAEIIKAAQ
ncbi:MAG: hypothetical protein HUK20_03555 [Fibrobacter sp.]|nr:hypothetical protein [Fibrobacter sp.]